MTKLKTSACAALLALAVLAAGTVKAQAKTIILTCQPGANDPSSAPFIIKIDTDKKTVFDSRPAASGTYMARITDEEISWDENPHFYFTFTLNRMTGNLRQMGTGTAAGASFNFPCHKAEKQF